VKKDNRGVFLKGKRRNQFRPQEKGKRGKEKGKRKPQQGFRVPGSGALGLERSKH
jgi:hypothetical protein